MLSSGNTDTTLLFEGESDHLVPSTSQILVESDMFMMAGRMVGHSFIHGGPCLSGISPAVIHVLLGRPPETATIQLQDCPDLDHRARYSWYAKVSFKSLACHLYDLKKYIISK